MYQSTIEINGTNVTFSYDIEMGQRHSHDSPEIKDEIIDLEWEIKTTSGIVITSVTYAIYRNIENIYTQLWADIKKQREKAQEV